MPKNELFKRTVKKLHEDDIKSIVTGSYKTKFTHYYLKFDGVHVELHWDGSDVKMITRGGHDIAHLVPYIVNDIKSNPYWKMYTGIFACELVNLNEVLKNPKNSWSATMSAVGGKTYKSDVAEVSLVIYDVHQFEGQDVTDCSYAERLQLFMPRGYDSVVTPKAVEPYDMFTTRLPFCDYCYIPRKYNINSLKQEWEYHVNTNKREGFVLFIDDANIQGIKWEHTFWKLKPLLDIDCIVTGFNEGKAGTRLEGKLGSFNVAVYKDGELLDIGKVPTMSDEERIKWTNRMKHGLLSNNKLVGDEMVYSKHVIQIKASEVTVKNKLRFPSYVRERTDKRPDECLFDQLT